MAGESSKSSNSFLDLFTLTGTDISTVNSYHVPIYPTVSLKEAAAPVQFLIPGAPNLYINLAESYLYCNIKVTANDGTDLPAKTDVSCTNFLIASMFDIFEFYLNGKLVSSKPMYAYCAYLLAQLSFSKDYKEQQLRSSLYIADNNSGKATDENTGYLARKTFIAESQAVELTGRLMDDICLQKRWLLPQVDIKIKLRRAPADFTLMSGIDTIKYKIELTEAIFYVKTHLVTPSIVAQHERILEHHKALYPFTKNEIKCASLAVNTLTAVTENIFSSNQLPQRIVVGLVLTDAVTGRLSKNPFNFESFKLSKIILSINNIALEYNALTLNYNDDRYLTAYQSLVNGLNLDSKTIGIDRLSYKDGNVLYAFQIQSSESDSNFYPTQGTLKLEWTFAEKLSHNVTAIILSQTQNVLTIDRFRNCEVENQGVLQ